MKKEITEIEKKIIEKRTNEASKKGLLGFAGKLGTILKNLGQPILMQEDGLWGSDENNLGYRATSLNDYLGFDIDDDFQSPPDQMETMEDYDELGNPKESPTSAEWSQKRQRKVYEIEIIGWYFESLSSGINLEIKYDERKNKNLTVHYKGYKVYEEIGNELVMYTPEDEWEGHVNNFFKTARKREQKTTKIENEKIKIKSAKKKASWLEHMKQFWGFTMDE